MHHNNFHTSQAEENGLKMENEQFKGTLMAGLKELKTLDAATREALGLLTPDRLMEMKDKIEKGLIASTMSLLLKEDLPNWQRKFDYN